MASLVATIEDLVAANRILSQEGIVDAFGHVSARHPDDPGRFLLARARAPRRVEAEDIMEFRLDGEPVDRRGREIYLERYIHAALYQARPELRSVVHSHSMVTVPFGTGGEKIRPMLLNTALIGKEVPIWDSRDGFGDTDLMVTDMAMGRDLARVVGDNPTALMRGHGAVGVGRSVRRAVFVSIKLQEAAYLQQQASRYETVKFLSPGEVDKMVASLDEVEGKPLQGLDRAWEYWCDRAGVPFKPIS